jgi:hypothetical protein
LPANRNRRGVVILSRRLRIIHRKVDLRSSEPSLIINDPGYHRQGILAALVALAFVGALGTLRSFDPFNGDQALFTVGALALHGGGTLYRDFWDLKQPGIFAFYLTAGSAFGFTQTALHAADVVWQCTLGAAAFVALRRIVRRPAVAAFAVLASPGAYFAGTTSWHLTQVEALAGLPLFGCAWAALAAEESPRRRSLAAFCSGVAAGCVTLLKLLYLPVAVAIFVAATGRLVGRRAGARLPGIGRWWALGTALPLLLFGLYITKFGLGKVVFETFFVLPSHIVATGHAPLSRLALSAAWFLRRFAPLVLLALAGAVLERTPRSRGWRRVCYTWLAVAMLAIALQAQSWWEYQFIILLPPLGILATLGLDALIQEARSSAVGRKGGAAVALAVAALLAFPLAHAAEATVRRVARDRPFASAAALSRYRIAESGEYADAARDAAFLAPGPGRPPVFVCGDPLIYVLARRAQAVAVNGWALELYPPDWWAVLNAQLERARPADVFVANQYAGLIRTRSPAFERLLVTRYARAARFPDGAWYRLTTSRPSL